MIDAPLVPSSVYGLRTWRPVPGDGGERLAGPGRGTVWPDSGGWLVAECTRGAGHAAPAPGCTCGIHAWHPRRRSAAAVLATRREIPGVVEAQGAIEVHEDGFRAERARPYALVVAPGRNAALAARLAAAHRTPLVEVRGPEALLAWCRERDLGLGEDAVGALLGRPADERRRARRRRAGAAALRLAAAILGAAALVLAAQQFVFDPPGDRVLHGRTGEVRPR